MNIRRLLLTSLFAVPLMAVGAYAQPNPPSSSTNYFTDELLCSAGGATPVDTAFANRQDTVVALPDADGFFSIFNGKDFTGWWQNCRSNHSSANRTSGAIFRVDTNLKAIYSNSRGGVGGLLSTKKRYLHYEIVFEIWAGYGNDGGLFNRNPVSGSCYQTVLDYLSPASFGGTWGEGSFGSRDLRPFTFTSSSAGDTSISVPATGTSWKLFTAARRTAGETFNCPTDGCTQTDWRANWKTSHGGATNLDGWNTVRVKFYGGTTTAHRVNMRSFFKSKLDTATKVSTIQWIPIWADSLLLSTQQINTYGGGIPNPIAFQVHTGTGNWSGARGTWYRNIRMRELDSLGNPLPWTVSLRPGAKQTTRYEIKLGGTKLMGMIDSDYRAKVTNLNGQVVETFRGSAGQMDHDLQARGVLFMELKTAKGVQNLSLGRVYE